MGGKLCDLRFEPVCRPGAEREDIAATRASFDSFQVGRCTCFLPEDKEKILGVITAAYGDSDGFEAAVRDIFDCAHWRAADDAGASPGSPASWASLAVTGQLSLASFRWAANLSNGHVRQPLSSSGSEEGSDSDTSDSSGGATSPNARGATAPIPCAPAGAIDLEAGAAPVVGRHVGVGGG